MKTKFTGSERHKFISFWLWFCTVINVLCTIGYFALLFSSKGLWTGTPEPTWLRIIWVVESAITVPGYVLLLRGNKTGFYLLVVMSIVKSMIDSFVTGEIIVSLVSMILSLVILYSILKLKKDGVSYWDAMDYASMGES